MVCRDESQTHRYKNIECIIDNLDMFQFKKDFIKKEENKYFCDGKYIQKLENESISVKFRIDNTYDVFLIMGSLWGDWNHCPNWMVMEQKAKEWYERYSAELVQIAHDTLKFQCRRTLDKEEVLALITDVVKFAPNSLDIADYDIIKDNLTNEGTFILWWD